MKPTFTLLAVVVSILQLNFCECQLFDHKTLITDAYAKLKQQKTTQPPALPRVNSQKQWVDFNLTTLANVDALGDIGYTLEADYDLNAGYKWPWYNKGKFMMSDLSVHFKLGGIAHLVLHLYFIRLHLWIDFVGTQMDIAKINTKLDIESYRALCASIMANHQNLRLKMNF